MENATKALMIAAGVLVGIMLITLMIYGYEQVSSYYAAKEENKKIEQLADFNKQYIPYNRDDVRGSDIISLVNKIVDFNNLKDEEEITISIQIKKEDVKNFYFNYDKNKSVTLIPTNGIIYTEDTIYNIGHLMDVAKKIENIYTQGMATKLSANISTLMGENSRKTKEDLLKELKINYSVNNNDILKYYQYVQFKRAHFNCEKLEYTEQGRVKNFTFKFNGKIE